MLRTRVSQLIGQSPRARRRISPPAREVQSTSVASIARAACVGIVGLGDRPADRRGSRRRRRAPARGVTTRFWSPALAVGRAHAGDDEEAVGPELSWRPRPRRPSRRRRRARPRGRARSAARPGRAARRRRRSTARSSSSRLVSTVTATTLVPGRRGRLGVLHHRPAAGGVDGEDRRLERAQRLDRLGDGVGDVVELEIEEDRQAELGHLAHAGRAVGGRRIRGRA